MILIGISLGKETYKKHQIQKEIEGLQSDIQKLNQENGDLNNLISYLSTTDFREKEAREKLNLQKEDEKMIVLRKELEAQKKEPAANDAPTESPGENNRPNWQKWLGYFFSNHSL